MTTIPPTPEFSRLIRVDALKENPKSFKIKASAEECAALAERFSLLSVESLSANIRLTLQKDGLARLEGGLSAKVTQTCVITLEPVESFIETSFDQLHGGDPEEIHKEMEFPGNDGDAPEPFVGGAMDLGEITAEKLALELETFPRKHGVDYKRYDSGGGAFGDEEKKHQPFAGLAKLIKEKE